MLGKIIVRKKENGLKDISYEKNRYLQIKTNCGIRKWTSIFLVIILVSLSIQADASTVFHISADRYGTINNTDNSTNQTNQRPTGTNIPAFSSIPYTSSNSSNSYHSPKPYLGRKKLSLYKDCMDYVVLKNASKSVKWTTSNKAIVQLKKYGNAVLVTALSEGTCTLKARYRGKSYSCKVTCKGIMDNAVDLNCSSITIPVGGTASILITMYVNSIEFHYSYPQGLDLEWGEGVFKKKSNNRSAYIRATVTITAHIRGNFTLKIRNSHNPNEVDYCTVSVI